MKIVKSEKEKECRRKEPGIEPENILFRISLQVFHLG